MVDTLPPISVLDFEIKAHALPLAKKLGLGTSSIHVFPQGERRQQGWTPRLTNDERKISETSMHEYYSVTNGIGEVS